MNKLVLTKNSVPKPLLTLKTGHIFGTRFVSSKMTFEASKNSINTKTEELRVNPINEQYIYEQLLENKTFTKAQANKLLSTFQKNMNLVIQERIKKEQLTTREELMKVVQIKTNAFNKIENEIIMSHLEKIKDYKQELTTISSDLEKLQKNLNMEIRKCNGAFKLDLSLEKGRIKEINANQELKIKDIDTKLSEEINTINAKIEGNKTQLMQWMYTMVFAALGIVLAFFRLLN